MGVEFKFKRVASSVSLRALITVYKLIHIGVIWYELAGKRHTFVGE
jgi:hypothetical protein